MKRILLFVILTDFLCPLTSGSCAFAETITTTLSVTRNDLVNAGASQFDLSFLIGGAQVTIIPSSDTQTIVRAVVTYDDTDPEPTLSTTTSTGRFTASFRSGWELEGNQIEEWDDLLSSLQEWDITIGDYDIATDITLACGGVTADVDFGGLPLSTCALELGGVSMDVDFSTPTSRRIERLRVDCGGALLSIWNIGNTDFERFQLDGGGTAVSLDFEGAYVSEQHDVNITVAGSTQNITVPSGAGEEVNVVSIATPVVVQGSDWDTQRRLIFKNFVTTDYDTQNVKLDIDITAVGSIVVIDRE